MTKEPAEQQKTDAERIASTGTGKLDHDTPPRTEPARPDAVASANAGEAGPGEPPAAARERIERERQAAIDRLRHLGVSPQADPDAPRADASVVRDEGDAAQASERTDLAFMTRERLAGRINQLTAALERIARGEYGRCADCGGPIERTRLAAMPEAETCLACQQRREARAAGAAA